MRTHAELRPAVHDEEAERDERRDDREREEDGVYDLTHLEEENFGATPSLEISPRHPAGLQGNFPRTGDNQEIQSRWQTQIESSWPAHGRRSNQP